MNYLAHAYLSFQHPEIVVGNMISDFVKGKQKEQYPEWIQKGITLHRLIDAFTDQHPATSSAKEIFRKDYRLYAGAFVDIVYDHFLALSLDNHFLESLAQHTYLILEQHLELLPPSFLRMFPYMKSENWLYHYRFTRGTEKSFGGLVRRAKYLHSEAAAIALFHSHYETLRQCYLQFFPELYQYVSDQKIKMGF